MKQTFFFLIIIIAAALSSCRYKAVPEPLGTSEAVPSTEISLGGVLADRIYGFGAIDSAMMDRQPIAIEGILSLQEKAAKMRQQKQAAISDSLLGEWKSMKHEVDLNFENFAAADLKKWIELNDSLLKYTGLVCFADELEKMLYNTQSPEVITEQVVKSVIYTRRYDRIYVNVYNNSTVDFEHSTGGKVRLIQDTDYPDDGKIRLKVEMEDTRYMDLYVRIPEWADVASVSCKGVKYPVYPGQYTEIAKKWTNGDEVEVILGMATKLVKNELNQFSFTYGPLILSYVSDSTMTALAGGTDPLKELKFVSPPGKMPTFTFSGIPDHTLVLQPFYAEKDSSEVRTAWISIQ